MKDLPIITEKVLSSPHELKNLIPNYIYSSNNYKSGIYKNSKEEAINHRFIQINSWIKSTLLFDIDQAEWSAGMWTDFGLPPTWITRNEKTGNCHFGYTLEKPVICNHWKPVEYFANVQFAMNHLLNGDVNYPGLITKNPFHGDHRLFWYGNLYTLDMLAKASLPFAPLKPKRKRIEIDLTKVNNGERNVSMFHEVRGVSYVEIRNFRGENRIFSLFYEKMLEHSKNLNYCLIEPLTLPEVKHITTSVCKWTFAKDPKVEEQFKKRQSGKGKKNSREHLSRAGKLSGIKRREGSLMELKPWESHGISRQSFYKWIKAGKVDKYGNLLKIL